MFLSNILQLLAQRTYKDRANKNLLLIMQKSSENLSQMFLKLRRELWLCLLAKLQLQFVSTPTLLID